MSTCISARELHGRIQAGRRIAIIDTRWSRDRSSYCHYTMAHIPLALFSDPTYDLVGIPDREHGRNPLPELARVQDAVDRWGLTDEHEVVVYDKGDGLLAARAWWILTWAGIKDVKVLRCGLRGWEEEGFDTAGGPGNLPQPGDLTVTAGNLPVVDVDEVAAWPGKGVLIDARELPRFQGRAERLDLQAGHIPGAVNLPVRALQRDGEFLPAEDIRAKLAEVGVTSGDQVAVYSGSGLHSSLFIQAMHEAGMPGASLFIGGWSKWAGDPARPIVRL
ncbi:sulfurtransferase [Corynebacterium hansenii]|uniref:Sulfurtransferase n=1 Tax=Corynebacterium hansenii TaxID=394964 RepID=A0ABV7ZTW5_9CORY|nr:rhodanese-like domain-containing protein [Corynebacterium hansenii]WJZ01154.1 3-mercaptopyruvate sulfurtransferase [Corynebacterium hansenii]